MTGAEIVTLVSTVASLVGGIVGMVIRSRMQRERLREAARRDHVKQLPPDSLIVDLGKNGMVIEVGGSTPRRQARG